MYELLPIPFIALQGFLYWGGGGGGDWGITPNIQKISLSPHVPPLFCPKNVDFVIFMQFLVILFKMSPH